MAKFLVKKEFEDFGTGAVYLEGHEIEIEFSDLALMDPQLREEFDEFFEASDPASEAFAETYLDLLERKGGGE